MNRNLKFYSNLLVISCVFVTIFISFKNFSELHGREIHIKNVYLLHGTQWEEESSESTGNQPRVYLTFKVLTWYVQIEWFDPDALTEKSGSSPHLKTQIAACLWDYWKQVVDLMLIFLSLSWGLHFYLATEFYSTLLLTQAKREREWCKNEIIGFFNLKEWE